MKLTTYDIARMIDISCVRSYNTREDIEQMARAAMEYSFICAHVLPSNIPYLKELLAGNTEVLAGCPVGFPSGGSETKTKIQEMKNCVALGCDEIDVVINVGWMRSGLYKQVEEDVRAVIGASGDTPVKLLLEVSQLNDEQISRGAEIAMRVGAGFVKTGTGWMDAPTTIHHIDVIKEVVGERIGIKASGGIRGLATIVEMHKMGVTRFGVGYQASLDIIEESKDYPGGIEL